MPWIKQEFEFFNNEALLALEGNDSCVQLLKNRENPPLSKEAEAATTSLQHSQMNERS